LSKEKKEKILYIKKIKLHLFANKKKQNKRKYIMPPPCMEQHSLVFQQQKYLGEGGTLNVIFVTYMNKQLLWGIRFDLYFPPPYYYLII
jgi:hypothetical protein